MGNFLSTATLNDGGVAVVDVGAGDFLFDDSEPAASEFTTGSTQTFTNNIDGYRGSTDTAPQVFDLLGGADYAFLGSGDNIRGGAGDDLLFGDDGDGTAGGVNFSNIA